MATYIQKRKELLSAVYSDSSQKVFNILSDQKFVVEFFHRDIEIYSVILFLIEKDMVETMKSIISLVDTVLVGNTFPLVGGDNKYMLGTLLQKEQYEMFKLILQFGKHRTLNPMSVISPSYYDNACVCFCIHNNLYDLTKLLLENPNVDAGARDNKSLILAIKNNNIDIVKMLLSRSDVDPGAKDNQTLIYSVKNAVDINDSIEIVEMLLARNDVDPNARECAVLKIVGTNNGCTVLSLLAKRNDVDFRRKVIYDNTCKIETYESFIEFCIRKNYLHFLTILQYNLPLVYSCDDWLLAMSSYNGDISVIDAVISNSERYKINFTILEFLFTDDTTSEYFIEYFHNDIPSINQILTEAVNKNNLFVFQKGYEHHRGSCKELIRMSMSYKRDKILKFLMKVYDDFLTDVTELNNESSCSVM